MGFSKGIKRLGVFSALSATLVLASACSGVSQADLDAAKKQTATAEQKATGLQQQLAAKTQEVSTVQKQLDEAKKNALPDKTTMLIGVKGPLPAVVPPVPTATPPGFVAPPKPKLPDSYRQPLDFALYVETLATTHQSDLGYVATVSCMPSSVFKRGQRIVWRFEVYDIKAGKRLIGDDGPTVQMLIPGVDPIKATFSQRAGGRVSDAPWMWAAYWDVPLNYNLGALGFQIKITTKDGRSFTWKEPALISEGTDSRTIIVQ